jgi:hypothetical protein
LKDVCLLGLTTTPQAKITLKSPSNHPQITLKSPSNHPQIYRHLCDSIAIHAAIHAAMNANLPLLAGLAAGEVVDTHPHSRLPPAAHPPGCHYIIITTEGGSL